LETVNICKEFVLMYLCWHVSSQDNTVMDLREMEWEGVDWMNLAQDRDE
jgi:hypothetical protein